MELHWIGVLILVVIFALSGLRGLNLGVLALVASFLLGCVVLGLPAKELLEGFPGDLFLVLVAVTFLFGIARVNGTVDLLVGYAMAASRNRRAVIPWVLFVVTAGLCAAGAASPAAIAIVAPIGMTFAIRQGINPLYAGLMTANGAAAGAFAPSGILGGIVLSTVHGQHLDVNSGALFAGTFVFNVAVAVLSWAVFGRSTVPVDAAGAKGTSTGDGHGTSATVVTTAAAGDGSATATATSRPAVAVADGVDTGSADVRTTPSAEQIATGIGIASLVVGATVFGLDTGFTALTIAAVLALVFRETATSAMNEIAWPVVLLVCGIVTYVALLTHIGVVDSLGELIAAIGAPLVALLAMCYIAGVVSAFASTTAILGALIPLSLPFLQTGALPVTVVVIALCAAATVVDASPFSTGGALVVASAPPHLRAQTYRGLLLWGAAMCVLAPAAAWSVAAILS